MAGKRNRRSNASTTESTNAKRVKIVLKEEESEDDEGSVIGICPCKRDCEVGRPERLNALDYPHILSQIIDEALMRMKDVRDKADYTYFCRTQLPPGTLQGVIRQTERKYALPKGTIPESTIKSRMKAYKKQKATNRKSSLSLLETIEQPLLRWCIREALSNPDEPAEDILHCLNIIDMAKALLQEKQRRLDGDDLIFYNPAKDWMKLDWNWVYDFKYRAFDALAQKGVYLDKRNYESARAPEDDKDGDDEEQIPPALTSDAIPSK